MIDPQTLDEMRQDPLRPYAKPLRDLIRKHILMPVDTSRQFQLIMALRNELYWRAKQYLKFKFVNNGITLVPISGPPGASGGEPRTGEVQALSYTFNITRADGQKFVAIVGARPPRMNFTARDPHDSASIKQASDAKAVGKYLADLWNMEQHQKDLARTIFRSGPQFGHLCWVADEKKFGTAELLDTEVVDVEEPTTVECQECGASQQAGSPDVPPMPCPDCGSPSTAVIPGAKFQALQATGTQQIPKGMPELHSYTVFDVTIPPERATLETCEWLHCEKLESSGKLRSLYGDLVASIKEDMPSGGDTASNAAVAEAYDLIASADPNATARMDRWWWGRTWLTPDMYHYAEDPQLKKILVEQYPDGVRVVFCNEVYVEGVPEKMVDVWSVCKTGTDDRIMGDPICHDLIPINEIINNFFNLAIETVLRAIPKTIVNPRLMDRAAIQSNQANVAEVLFAKAGLSENLSDMVVKMPQASFSEQMMELATTFRQYSREIDGVIEAVFGGGDAAPTWRQDQQRKNQALAQFYIAYDEMRAYWKSVNTKALKLLQKYGVGQLKIPAQDSFAFGPTDVDLSLIDPSMINVEAEETMPQTRAEEADELRDQFTLPPQVQEAIGLFHPVNMPRIVQLISLPGMISPDGDLTRKTLEIVQQLAMQEPIPQMDPMSGQPAIDPTGQPVLQPSIPPDPFEFKNAAFAVEVVRAFINSQQAGQLQQTNPAGYQNVKLFGQALDMMAMPPMPPPGAPPSGGPPPPAPPQ